MRKDAGSAIGDRRSAIGDRRGGLAPDRVTARAPVPDVGAVPSLRPVFVQLPVRSGIDPNARRLLPRRSVFVLGAGFADSFDAVVAAGRPGARRARPGGLVHECPMVA